MVHFCFFASRTLLTRWARPGGTNSHRSCFIFVSLSKARWYKRACCAWKTQDTIVVSPGFHTDSLFMNHYCLSLPIYALSNSYPRDNSLRKWVVCSLQVSTTKPRLIVVYSLFHAFWFLSTWFEFSAVGVEGHLYRTFLSSLARRGIGLELLIVHTLYHEFLITLVQ